MSCEAPQIYIACLAAYNSGYLHGSWVTVDGDVDDLEQAIEEIIKTSPVEDAEEWAIHDYQGWEGIHLDENESLDRLVELAKLIQEHGKAFALYCQHYGDDATAENFTNYFRGVYESEEDFVQEMWEEEGKLKELEKLGVTVSYINWEAIARDWFIDSYFSAVVSHTETYVFSRH